MKKLNKYEEIKIIQTLMKESKFDEECGLLGYGSSRAVFEYKDEYVVKIAADDGGRIQNKHEIEMFKEHPEICADLIAYGSTIIVMEKLDVDTDYYELIDSYYYHTSGNVCSQDDEDYIPEEKFLKTWNIGKDDMDDILGVIDTAEEVLGYTSDNYQIGYSQNKGYCLYDYGFDVEYNQEDNNPSQVGNVEFFLYRFNDSVYTFLEEIVNRIRHSNLRFKKLERKYF